MCYRFELALGKGSPTRVWNGSSGLKKFVTLNYNSQFQHLNLFKAYMRSLLLGFLLVIVLSPAAFSQQDPQYTMFMFNRFVQNPAYAGALQATNITGLGRAQWVGIPQAPSTSTASINGYSKVLHGGLGAYLIGDRLGPLSTMGAKGAYAFHMNFGGGKAKLNIGVAGGIYQKVLNGDWIYNQSGGVDPVLPTSKQSIMVPDLDAGMYFHVPLKNTTSTAFPQDRFYIGGSVTHILEPSMENLMLIPNSIKTVLPRGIQGSAGYVFTLGPSTYLEPNVNFRMAGPTNQFDINLNLYVSPMVFGISHRGLVGNTADSFSGIIGFNASTYMFIGYSYDYTTSKLGTHTTGSHEVIISYTFPSKYKNMPPMRGTRVLQIDHL
jgi:type IX secretion system PorP/SprF family membrane protein